MALPTWLSETWARVGPYAQKLAVWQGYEQELQTLAIYGIGIAIYTALVFAFYQSLSKRKPFHFPTSGRAGWQGRASRFAERALVFPVASFLYFSVLAASLFFLVKAGPDGRTTQELLLVAMAVVVGVRATVYLSESMSNDLAKLVPLSLLGVTLVDPGYLKLSDAWMRLGEASRAWPLLARYFLLFIALEAVLSSVRWSILRAHSKVRGKETSFRVEVKDAQAASPETRQP